MRILYLYNKEDWALHNVGKLWFRALPKWVSVDLVNYHTIDDLAEFSKGYNYVWFSYFLMYCKFLFDPTRSIVTVHDPMELFPQVPDWKDRLNESKGVGDLGKIKHLSVISEEMRDILEDFGVKSFLLPTSTTFDIIEERLIKTVKCSTCSVANNYPRKNFALLDKVRNRLKKENNINLDLKIGYSVILEENYISYLRSHEIYICTSYQEGGPIPAFDAMSQGATILTTPVGQIQELIVDGENGFICKNEDDFVEKVVFLSNHYDKLNDMRLASRNTIIEKRGRIYLESRMLDFMEKLRLK